MKHSKTTYFLFGLLFVMGISKAQSQTTITGKIVNNKKEPIISASITIKNSGIGTSSDSAGVFSLSIVKKRKYNTTGDIGRIHFKRNTN